MPAAHDLVPEEESSSASDTSADDDSCPDRPDSFHSTPMTEDMPFEPNITPFRTGSSSFVFLDRARNVRRALDRGDNNITLLRDTTVPDEPNPVTSAKWKSRDTDMHKYIDDCIMDTKLNFETVELKSGIKDKHAIDTQNVFKRTIYNAESIGMKVNTDKTNLLCISDSLSFKATAHIFSMEGTRLTSSDGLKLLGFKFGPRPNCDLHVQGIKRTFRGRYWLLIHMRQHYYTEEELVKAYKSLVRPIAEYCSVVFHSMLTDKQDEELERLQATALRYIYGYGIPYADMRRMSDLKTLRQRRIEATDKFALNCTRSDRFKRWFPENKQTRRSRHQLTYKEEYARCDRLKNSPIFYMRRRLNGKPGKSYGQRYRHYRDA